MFNKGLDKNEKQEGLLKRLKNIEGKTEQQLDLIRDQGNKQLDLIGRINANKTKGIEFQNERLKMLENEIKKKESDIKNKSKSNDGKEKKQVVFVYAITNNVTYHFSKYTHLMNFAEGVYKKELSLNEAKDEQKEMLKKFEDLEKRTNPRTGPKPKKQTKIEWKM